MERASASALGGTRSSAVSAAARVAACVLAAWLAPLADEEPSPGPRGPGATDSVGTPPAIPGKEAASTLPPSRPASSPHPDALTASVHAALGAGAPSFPQRDRFRLESVRRADRDSLSVDQPWDGSQLGFSASLETSLRWRFLRPVAGAQWTFWDSRAVLRDRRTDELLERTWRVDQLVGQVGFDALVPRGLLTISKAHDPYVGWRASYGLGRLEGLGRAWARGGGWQAHVGADVWALGPFQLGGRFGWSSLAMESDATFERVLYEGQGPDILSWNGSGIWLELVLRFDPARPGVSTSPPSKETSSLR